MNKYFISFAFTNNENKTLFGNVFYECNQEITNEKILKEITIDISEECKISDIAVINFIKL